MSFDDFWSIYPRRIAKLKARTAWDKALKHSPEQEILNGVRRYALERQDENPKFTKHPTTWLNGGCWMDDPGANNCHEKSYAELADDLRQEIAADHGAGGSEPDLFGTACIAGPRDNRHR